MLHRYNPFKHRSIKFMRSQSDPNAGYMPFGKGGIGYHGHSIKGGALEWNHMTGKYEYINPLNEFEDEDETGHIIETQAAKDYDSKYKAIEEALINEEHVQRRGNSGYYATPDNYIKTLRHARNLGEQNYKKHANYLEELESKNREHAKSAMNLRKISTTKPNMLTVNYNDVLAGTADLKQVAKPSAVNVVRSREYISNEINDIIMDPRINLPSVAKSSVEKILEFIDKDKQRSKPKYDESVIANLEKIVELKKEKENAPTESQLKKIIEKEKIDQGQKAEEERLQKIRDTLLEKENKLTIKSKTLFGSKPVSEFSSPELQKLINSKKTQKLFGEKYDRFVDYVREIINLRSELEDTTEEEKPEPYKSEKITEEMDIEQLDPDDINELQSYFSKKAVIRNLGQIGTGINEILSKPFLSSAIVGNMFDNVHIYNIGNPGHEVYYKNASKNTNRLRELREQKSILDKKANKEEIDEIDEEMERLKIGKVSHGDIQYNPAIQKYYNTSTTAKGEAGKDLENNFLSADNVPVLKEMIISMIPESQRHIIQVIRDMSTEDFLSKLILTENDENIGSIMTRKNFPLDAIFQFSDELSFGVEFKKYGTITNEKYENYGFYGILRERAKSYYDTYIANTLKDIMKLYDQIRILDDDEEEEKQLKTQINELYDSIKDKKSIYESYTSKYKGVNIPIKDTKFPIPIDISNIKTNINDSRDINQVHSRLSKKSSLPIEVILNSDSKIVRTESRKNLNTKNYIDGIFTDSKTGDLLIIVGLADSIIYCNFTKKAKELGYNGRHPIEYLRLVKSAYGDDDDSYGIPIEWFATLNTNI